MAGIVGMFILPIVDRRLGLTGAALNVPASLEGVVGYLQDFLIHWVRRQTHESLPELHGMEIAGFLVSPEQRRLLRPTQKAILQRHCWKIVIILEEYVGVLAQCHSAGCDSPL